MPPRSTSSSPSCAKQTAGGRGCNRSSTAPDCPDPHDQTSEPLDGIRGDGGVDIGRPEPELRAIRNGLRRGGNRATVPPRRGVSCSSSGQDSRVTQKRLNAALLSKRIAETYQRVTAAGYARRGLAGKWRGSRGVGLGSIGQTRIGVWGYGRQRLDPGKFGRPTGGPDVAHGQREIRR